MKNMFLELSMVSFKYPKHVYDLAKRSGVSPKQIAERDNIEALPVISATQWRFDIVIQVIMINEDDEDPNRSIVDLSNGTFEIVNMNHRKLARKITKFVNDNNIKFVTNSEQLQEYEDEEEREEMEGD